MSGGADRSHPQQGIVITAAAGGIGSALSRVLATQGHRLVLVDISRRRLDKIQAELKDLGAPDVIAVKADLTDEAQVNHVVATAHGALGGIDGLANIVGGIVGDLETFYDKDLNDLEPAEWDRTFEVNVRPTYLMTRAVTRHMRLEGGGAVVNVASMAHLGRLPEMGNVAYDAAKAAVVAMTHTLSWQLGPFGVRVNAVAPGLTLSPGLERSVSPRLLEAHRDATPLGRNGSPEDVANVMAFLLSDASRHVSGEVVNIAGGRA